MLLFNVFGTLVYMFKFIFSSLYFVPMLCSLVLVVNVMHFFKYHSCGLVGFYILDAITLVFVLVECWTCK